MDGIEYELVVYGYIRLIENEQMLYSNIADGLYQEILQFYPKLRKFELYDRNLFYLEDDGTKIKAIKRKECHGFLIYAQCFQNGGYKKGIHSWSIQYSSDIPSSCFKKIGIISCKNTDLLKMEDVDCDIFMKKNKIFYHLYPKNIRFWTNGQIVTLKLNCDDNALEFYHPDFTKEIVKCSIERDQSWYFVARLCAKRKWCDFNVIDDCFYTPI